MTKNEAQKNIARLSEKYFSDVCKVQFNLKDGEEPPYYNVFNCGISADELHDLCCAGLIISEDLMRPANDERNLNYGILIYSKVTTNPSS